ncbi:MAG: tRNA (adenine-N1)-methyltransferase [Nanoarchaeota archaeon]|nr:tRNA (adenine-N1)-methyltransferase [Nanoarchaeota archaeon]
MIKKILIDRRNNKYYWTKGDLHTLFGIVKEKDIIDGKEKVYSHSKKEFLIFDACFKDNIEKIKRNAAVTHLKDIGSILTYTGIGKDSVVLESGAGSGNLTLFLSNFVKKVYSYEKNNEFFNIVTKNLDNFDIKNVELKLKDIYEGIDEDNLDLIMLDLNEPWRCLQFIDKLKSGRYLVAYLPTIKQVEELVNESKKVNLYFEKCVEIMEREWYVEDLKVRPKNKMLGHTAFLVFFRKY